MSKKKVKVGARGQVVIPKRLREELHLTPGAEVFVSTDGAKVIITPATEDLVEFFERTAKSGKGPGPRVGPHDSEQELEARHRRYLRSAPLDGSRPEGD